MCIRDSFWGAPPKILDRHYKTRPSTDHRAKFRAGRPTHLGDLARKEKKTSCVKQKSFRKLSFSGGLKNKPQQNLSPLRKLSLPVGLIKQIIGAQPFLYYCSGAYRDASTTFSSPWYTVSGHQTYLSNHKFIYILDPVTRTL